MTAHKVRRKRLAEGMRSGRMVRITIGLEPTVFALLKYAAHRRQVPASAVLRAAVVRYLLRRDGAA